MSKEQGIASEAVQVSLIKNANAPKKADPPTEATETPEQTPGNEKEQGA